jgi:hypothetical protein
LSSWSSAFFRHETRTYFRRKSQMRNRDSLTVLTEIDSYVNKLALVQPGDWFEENN